MNLSSLIVKVKERRLLVLNLSQVWYKQSLVVNYNPQFGNLYQNLDLDLTICVSFNYYDNVKAIIFMALMTFTKLLINDS